MPEAQLTHPNSFIAIIIAFLSLLLESAFSIPLYLQVIGPTEFTLWLHGEPLPANTSALFHAHTYTQPIEPLLSVLTPLPPSPLLPLFS